MNRETGPDASDLPDPEAASGEPLSGRASVRRPERALPSKKHLHIESSGQLCIYCGACVGVCPLNCVYLDETRITFDEKICTRCEICVRACPVGAIAID